MLTEDEKGIAIADARARHAALFELIRFTDIQAMALLRLYAPLGVAAGSAAIAGFTTNALIPAPIAAALAGATITFVAGASFCLKAMETTEVSFPGRGAEFWIWANSKDIGFSKVFAEYMENLRKETELNREVNRRASHRLGRAKLCAVLAPVVAFGSGLLWLAAVA